MQKRRLKCGREIKSTMDKVEEVFRTEADNLSDEVLIKRLDLLKYQRRMERLSKVVKDMFHCSDTAVANQVDEIMGIYNACKRKNQYCEAIINEATRRNVSKEV